MQMYRWRGNQAALTGGDRHANSSGAAPPYAKQRLAGTAVDDGDDAGGAKQNDDLPRFV